MASEEKEFTRDEFVEKLLSDSPDSLFKILENYRTTHDKDLTTSDFLYALMKDLKVKYDSLSRYPESIKLLDYSFSVALKFFLEAQKKLLFGSYNPKPDQSSFVCCIVNSLGLHIDPQLGTIKKVTKSTDDSLAKMLEKFTTLITTIDLKINEKKIQHPFLDILLFDALQELFSYCATDEVEKSKNKEERKSIYTMLQTFLTANDLNIHAVFPLMKEVLIRTRNERATVAVTQVKYTLLENILKSKKPADIAKHQLDAILGSPYNAWKTSDARHHLYNEVLSQMILKIPEDIQDKSRYLYDKGPEWAEIMNILLKDTTLNTENRMKFERCAHTWNQAMQELKVKKVEIDDKYFVEYKKPAEVSQGESRSVLMPAPTSAPTPSQPIGGKHTRTTSLDNSQ